MSKPRTKEHRASMSAGHRKFLYITPFGTVDCCSGTTQLLPEITNRQIRYMSNNLDKIITKQVYAGSSFLYKNYTTDIIGKTYSELGFNKINKS